MRHCWAFVCCTLAPSEHSRDILLYTGHSTTRQGRIFALAVAVVLIQQGCPHPDQTTPPTLIRYIPPPVPSLKQKMSLRLSTKKEKLKSTNPTFNLAWLAISAWMRKCTLRYCKYGASCTFFCSFYITEHARKDRIDYYSPAVA